MTKSYAEHFSTKQTIQTEAIPGKAMTKNSAGGFSFAVDGWKRLDRFLILGAEGGSYYATEKALTVENAKSVVELLKEDGMRVVNRIKEVSVNGLAPKNDPAVFALAMAAGLGEPNVRKAALTFLPEVCRIGTHLFQFVEAIEKFRGWGRGLRTAVRDWYDKKEPDKLAYQLVKYQQRGGWSHRDLLRLSKRKAEGIHSTLYRWAVGKADPDTLMGVGGLELVAAFEAAKKATDVKQIIRLIQEYNLPRECIPTQFLTDTGVWEALLEKMPLTAMIRNLATLTRVGVIAPLSNGSRKVISELTNVERLRKSRVHPMAVLIALKTYASGKGDKSDKTWVPVPQVIDALDGAFYNAFGNVEPTGKRWMLGVDVSGSMSSPISGMNLSCAEAAAAMSLITVHTEDQYYVHGFSGEFVPLKFGKRTRLDDALKTTQGMNFGPTNCALPMEYALTHKIPVDVFTVLTDNETWFGSVHPCQALQQYREKMDIPAKLIVAAFVSNGFTIADPNDAGMMDVVGMSADVPVVMANFARE